MRKTLYTLAGLSALMLAGSCAKEIATAGPETDGLVEVTFELSAGTPQTKSIADGKTAKTLKFYAYDETGMYLPNLQPTNDGWSTFDENKTTLLRLKVVKDMKYQFAFVAVAPGADGTYYKFTPSAAKMEVDYAAVATCQNESADCFYAYKAMAFETSGQSQSIILTRPVAQINVGSAASDIEVAANSGIAVDAMKTSLKVEGVYTEMNLLTGRASGSATPTFALSPRPQETLEVGGSTYTWIAMTYVLADDAQTTKVDLGVDLVNTAGAALSPLERSVPNLPIQRNYRTNILGNIFSIEGEFNVEIDNTFATADGNWKGGYIPTYADVAALNAAFAAGAKPYKVALTALADGETIYLPKTSDPVDLVFGDFDGKEVTIAYAAGATDAEKPSEISLYAPALGTLNADLQQSSVIIVAGSDIAVGQISTRPGTLYIQETAHVGILTVGAGNIVNDGTIDSLVYPASSELSGNGTVGSSVQVLPSGNYSVSGSTSTPTDLDDVIAKASDAGVAVELSEGNYSLTSTDNDVRIVGSTGAVLDVAKAPVLTGETIEISDVEIVCTGVVTGLNAGCLTISTETEAILSGCTFGSYTYTDDAPQALVKVAPQSVDAVITLADCTLEGLEPVYIPTGSKGKVVLKDCSLKGVCQTNSGSSTNAFYMAQSDVDVEMTDATFIGRVQLNAKAPHTITIDGCKFYNGEVGNYSFTATNNNQMFYIATAGSVVVKNSTFYDDADAKYKYIRITNGIDTDFQDCYWNETPFSQSNHPYFKYGSKIKIDGTAWDKSNPTY